MIGDVVEILKFTSSLHFKFQFINYVPYYDSLTGLKKNYTELTKSSCLFRLSRTKFNLDLTPVFKSRAKQYEKANQRKHSVELQA